MKRRYKVLFLLAILTIISINAISASEIGLDDNNAIDENDGFKIKQDIMSEKIISDNEDADSNNANDVNTDSSDEVNEDNVIEQDTDTDTVDEDEEDPIIPVDTRLFNPDSVIKGNDLNIVLKDIDNNPLANQTIKFNINDKQYQRTTDKTGTAKLKINLSPKTHTFFIEYDGCDEYYPTNLVFDLKVIKPVQTKLSVKSTIVYKNNKLMVYLKTSDNKALANQKIKIGLPKKTYTRTTDKNGLASLNINLNPKTYSINLSYDGKGKYLPTSKKIKIHVFENELLGSTYYGKVELLKGIGNSSSKVKIAYVVGLHVLEHQIHDEVYNIMKQKTSMHYSYNVYKITLTKKSGNYNTDRMRGQILAKNYIVPHVNKQKYNLVVDVHSTTGVYYKKSYFIHVPQNRHKPSLNLANKAIKIINTLDKQSKIVYWSPDSQTSPPYLTLPIMKAGTPTFVFETLTSEPVSRSKYRANILINAVDKLFG